MDQRRVDHCVERLCNKGCRSVWDDIHALESGVVLSEVEGLQKAEIVRVVAELRSIMAVYGGSCMARTSTGL